MSRWIDMRSKLGSVKFQELGGIEYHGMAGISQPCLNAVRRIIQFGELPEGALLLSAGDVHAFLLCSEQNGDVAIKSGFSSGYGGEGPNALADALCALMAANIDVDEINVSEDLIDRLDRSALTQSDLEHVKTQARIRPMRLYDYIHDLPSADERKQVAWRRYPAVMPWHVIDSRLTDLATNFFDNPDRAIMDGFRRLEDRVRERIRSKEHGAKLFSIAFGGEEPALTWVREVGDRWALDAKPLIEEPVEKGEHTGRMQLFTGAYQAFRNPRAHRVLPHTDAAALAEFLMLNHLFLLEGAAQERLGAVQPTADPSIGQAR